MTFEITSPDRMNATFADAFNSRNVENLIRLYEPDAVLCSDKDSIALTGINAIRHALTQLLQVPGHMTSRNNFCLAHGDLALLRADWELRADDGTIVASGSSAELVRRQHDGRWLYVIDHALGASLPRLPASDKPA